MTTRARAHRTGRLVVLLVAALVAAACGLSEDGEPEALPPENLPPDLLDPTPASTTTTRGPGEVAVPIFLLEEVAGENHLVAVDRTVANPTQPEDRLEAVITAEPTAEEERRGLFTVVPPDLELLDAGTPQDGVLVVDLSADIFDVQGDLLSQAFAQIVFTATELETVTSVRFRVGGEPRNARDDEGGEQSVVDRTDYRSLQPR